MKRWSAVGVAAVALLTLLAASGSAAERNLIVTEGSSEVIGQNDSAAISLSVMSEGRDLEPVSTDNATTTAAVLKSLKGKTILYVSHALQTVEEFCDEVFLIHQGRLVARGDPSEVILKYIRSYMGEGGYLYTQEFGTRDAEITSVRLLDESGKEEGTFETGRTMTVEMSYEIKKRIEKPVFGFSLKTGNGFYVFGTNTRIMKVPIDAIEGTGTMRLKLYLNLVMR